MCTKTFCSNLHALMQPTCVLHSIMSARYPFKAFTGNVGNHSNLTFQPRCNFLDKVWDLHALTQPTCVLPSIVNVRAPFKAFTGNVENHSNLTFQPRYSFLDKVWSWGLSTNLRFAPQVFLIRLGHQSSQRV